MDKDLLNNLNIGEKVVEMTEYTLHNKIVYNVNVYICQSISWIFKKRKVKKYSFPFYFESKEIAKDFLEHWGDFRIVDTTYWNHDNKDCLALILNGDNKDNEFIMIDSYKKKLYSGLIGDYAQLEYGGVWAGTVTEYEHGRYSTHDMHMFNFKKIYEIIDLARKVKSSKAYIFKMIENENNN